MLITYLKQWGGITEAEEATAATNKTIIRARSIQGRSTSLTLKYDF